MEQEKPTPRRKTKSKEPRLPRRNLIAARRELGLTQAEVAEMCGTTEKNYGRWERGEIGKLRPGSRHRLGGVFRRTGDALDHLLALDDDGSSISTGDEEPDMRRRDFLRGGLAAAAGTANVGALARPASSTATDVSDKECLQTLALSMAQHRVDRVHASELPDEAGHYLAHHPAPTLLRRDEAGCWSFVHGSLVDLFVAQAVYEDIQAGHTRRLADAQTSHQTDQVIKDFISEDRIRAGQLRDWMHDHGDPVLRVNSAGILAKLGDPIIADDVIRAVSQDGDVRQLYMTAVLARAASMRWTDASNLAVGLDSGLVGLEVGSTLYEGLVGALILESQNQGDAVARWCSAHLLAQVPDPTDDVQYALRSGLRDASREIRATAKTALGV